MEQILPKTDPGLRDMAPRSWRFGAPLLVNHAGGMQRVLLGRSGVTACWECLLGRVPYWRVAWGTVP